MSAQGQLAYVWSDSNPGANYSLVEDFSIINNMIDTAPDYKSGRDYMKEHLLTFGIDEETAFDNISNDEKQIVSQHKLGTVSQRISVIGQVNNIDACAKYQVNVQKSRAKRALYANTWVQNELPNNKTEILAASQDVFALYNDFGIEGINRGDTISGLHDYYYGTNDFTNNGLIHSGFTPLTMSLSDFVDKISNITMNGVY